mmetsp:Transcript_126003/g.245761  ORF Transcript_126003/g.245761 Transcript_126003/m.245761 type:complete len:522 (+) Transcript_126003:66-1631(+)
MSLAAGEAASGSGERFASAAMTDIARKVEQLQTVAMGRISEEIERAVGRLQADVFKVVMQDMEAERTARLLAVSELRVEMDKLRQATLETPEKDRLLFEIRHEEVSCGGEALDSTVTDTRHRKEIAAGQAAEVASVQCSVDMLRNEVACLSQDLLDERRDRCRALADASRIAEDVAQAAAATIERAEKRFRTELERDLQGHAGNAAKTNTPASGCSGGSCGVIEATSAGGTIADSSLVARLVGEMDAELRMEFSSRMRLMHAELRGELLGEVAVRIAAVEARNGVTETLSAELQRIGRDSDARLERLEAANLDSRLTRIEYDQKWKAANTNSRVCEEKSKTSDNPECEDILGMTVGRARANSVSCAQTRTSSCSPGPKVTRSAAISRQPSAVLPNLLGSVRTSQSMPWVMLKGAKLQDQDTEVENQEVVTHATTLPRSSKASMGCNGASVRASCSRSRIASTERRTGGPVSQSARQFVACASYVPLATRHPQLTRIALPASVGGPQVSSGSWSARARLGVL